MPSTYSPLLRFELVNPGEQPGLWGTTTNVNLGTLVEQAIAGVSTINLTTSSDYTLSALNGTSDESRSMVLNFTGTPGDTTDIIIPAATKLYVVRNDTDEIFVFKAVGDPGAGVEVPAGDATLVFCDGASAQPGIATANVGTLTVSGGGTGQSSFTAGVLKSPGGTGGFTTGAVNLTSEVTGITPVANGGTGKSSTTLGSVLVGNGTAAMTEVSGTIIGQLLTWNGSSWYATVPASSGGTVTSVNVSSSAGGFSFSGGPITSSGTISMSISDASAARTALGLGSMATQASGDFVGTTNSQTITGAKLYTACVSLGASTPNSTFKMFSQSDNGGTGSVFYGAGSGAIACAALVNSTGGNLMGFLFGTPSSYSAIGSITTNGSSTNYNTTSDYRLKENFQPVTNASRRLSQLRVVSYSWKDNPAAGIEEGVIAHEAQAIVPYAVRGKKDEVDYEGKVVAQTVDYSKLVPLLLASLQEANARIDRLENVVRNLTS